MPRTTLDWLREALALAALAACFALVALRWGDLPPLVPSHFGIAGLPDRWGPRTGLWTLPAAGAFTYLLLTVISRFPGAMNVPSGVDKDSPAVRALLQSLMSAIKAVMALTFLYIEWTNVQTAMGHEQGLGSWFLPASTAATFGTIGFYLYRLNHAAANKTIR